MTDHTTGAPAGASQPGDSQAGTGFRAAWEASLMGTYPTPQVLLEEGRGAAVVDAEGRDYIDFLAGIAVASLGHGHERLAGAIARQAGRLLSVSNLVANRPAIDAAERLAARFDEAAKNAGAPGGEASARVFWCNSGSEANEAAIKLARRTGRPGILSTEGGFHGRALGSLSVTGQPAKRAPFEPLPGGVEFVAYGDAAAARRALKDADGTIGAVIVEPIQGENGVVVPPEGYLKDLRAACDEAGALLIADEVQTGAGRTGTFFAFEQAGAAPDVVTLAKGLGGGVPVGACLARGEAAGLLHAGDHGSTFGGNPLAAAAVEVVLDELDAGLADRAAERGRQAREKAAALPGVAGVRGAGLLIALELGRPVAKEAVAAGLSHGVLINATDDSTVRLVPPLVITEDELAEGLSRLEAALLAAGAAG